VTHTVARATCPSPSTPKSIGLGLISSGKEAAIGLAEFGGGGDMIQLTGEEYSKWEYAGTDGQQR
jgi:hypothetical protein